MRILINGLFLIPNAVGGTETLLRGLVQGLAAVDDVNEYVLCLGPEAVPTFTTPNARWRIIKSPFPSTQRAVRIGLEQIWLPRVASTLGAHLIHSTGYTAPLQSEQFRVASIHDMNYKRHPEDLSILERLVYSQLIPRVARSSHRVIALSDAARDDVIRWTGVNPNRVSTVYLGTPPSWPGKSTDDVQRLAAAGVREPFVLSVAAAYPHKNLERLVRAFPLEDKPKPNSHVQLVVVGLGGRALPAVRVAVNERSSDVRILGWVDHALLGSLYRRASALAFPSLYEGFGLPILEAMSAGTPVLTSHFGAMAEIAGDAAELIDPYDVKSIRYGLQRLTRDQGRHEELRQAGLRRAGEFSWERTARATVSIYRLAASESVHDRPPR
jgi:glycosyltransferase involved in cell wall biosynthesis